MSTLRGSTGLRAALLCAAALAALAGCQQADRDPPPDLPAPAAPQLHPVSSPTNLASQTLAGTAPPGVTLNVSGGAATAAATAAADGSFSVAVALNTAAAQTTVTELVVTYVQGGLTSAPARARIVHDPLPPAPPEPAPGLSPTRLNPAAVTGLAEPGALVLVAGPAGSASDTAGVDGTFSVSLPLWPNAVNALTLTAVDAAGNASAPRGLPLLHDDVPPPAAAASLLRAYFDGQRTVVEGNYGSVEPGADVSVQDVVTLNPAAAVTATSGGDFAASVAGGAAGNTVQVVVTDPAGNASLAPHATVTVSLGWTDLAPAGTAPSARFAAAGAVDWINDRFFVFGGLDATGTRDDGHFLSLVPGSEAWSACAAPAPPAARFGHATLFDAAGNRLLVLGGADPAGPTWYADLAALDVSTPGSETWGLPGVTGSLPPRAFFACAFDATGRRIFVYGGQDGAGLLSDLWEGRITGADVSWAPLTPSGTAPPALAGAAAVYDAGSFCVVLLGGRTSAGAVSDAVYVLDLSGPPTWSLLAGTGTVPGGRAGAGAALDPIARRLFLFGGDDGTARNNDVAVLDRVAGAWTAAAPGGAAPAAREGAVWAFDPSRLRCVLFGGSADGTAGPLFQDARALE